VLAGLNPDLTDRYPDADAPGGGEALRRRVLALRSLLEAVAARAPMAVLLDDLHWADRESRQAVVSLLGTVTERSALVVTTARTETEAGRISLEETERVSLEPLGEEEVRLREEEVHVERRDVDRRAPARHLRPCHPELGALVIPARGSSLLFR